jgi:hypothetical protein
MARDLSLAMVSALTANVIYPALLVDCSFADNNLHLWNGNGNIAWNSNTYVGVGDLGSIGAMEETTALEAKGVALTLSGLDSDLLGESINEVEAYHDCNIYLCLFDGPCGNIVETPFLSFSGYMDAPEIRDDGKTSTITFQIENKLLEMNMPCSRRFTSDDNRIDLSTRLTKLGLSTSISDTAFEFVNSIQHSTVWWGTSPTSTND